MNFTPEQIQEIKELAAQKLAERAWEEIKGDVDEIVCFSAARAAGMIDLSISQLNRTAPEFADFGPRDRRFTLAGLKRMVAARTVRRGEVRG